MTAMIQQMTAHEILDSRGFPTVRVDVLLSDGSVGCASVPSGKSTGEKEAFELRDKDKFRYRGKGVLQAVRHIEQIILPKIHGTDACDQAFLDQTMIQLDGTPDKRNLGANAILGVSLSIARAAAASRQESLTRYLADLYGATPHLLPVPMMNVINGGKHSDSGIAIQEFMLVPHGAHTISEAIRMAAETYQTLRLILEKSHQRVSIGDEGGFAPQLQSSREALIILTEAILEAGYKPGHDISIALDFAANDFYKEGLYLYEGHRWTAKEMTDYILELPGEFPIVSVEDGLAEDDWEGWVDLTKRANRVGLQCVADDIFVTNCEIFQRGIQAGIGNAILIKPNQVGTLTETFAALQLASESGYRTVVSHRSGETDDAFISDLAVATNAAQMKSGAPARGERVSKYNELMRIDGELEGLSLAKDLYASGTVHHDPDSHE